MYWKLDIFSVIKNCNFYPFLVTAHYFYSFFVRDNEEKLLKELYQRCNRTLRFIQNENLIPPDCYYRMKWRHVDNQDTLEFNKKSLSNLGKKYSASTLVNPFLSCQKNYFWLDLKLSFSFSFFRSFQIHKS